VSNSTDKARHWFKSDAAKRDKLKFRRLLRLVDPDRPDRNEAEDLLAGRLDRLWSYCELHQVRNFESLREIAEATEVPIKVIEAMADPSVMWIRHVKPSPDIIEARAVQGVTGEDITKPMAVVRMMQSDTERRQKSGSKSKTGNVQGASGDIHIHSHDEQGSSGPPKAPPDAESNGLAKESNGRRMPTAKTDESKVIHVANRIAGMQSAAGAAT